MAAAVGLMLVTAHGFIGSYADAVRATILYAAYGIVCILLSLRWRHIDDSKLFGLEFTGLCADVADSLAGVRCLAKHGGHGRLFVLAGGNLGAAGLDTSINQRFSSPDKLF